MIGLDSLKSFMQASLPPDAQHLASRPLRLGERSSCRRMASACRFASLCVYSSLLSNFVFLTPRADRQDNILMTMFAVELVSQAPCMHMFVQARSNMAFRM